MNARIPIQPFETAPAESAHADHSAQHDFDTLLQRHGIELPPLGIDTLQVNITKMCNQVCRHCHVDSSPTRTEALSHAGVERCIELLALHPQMRTLDITGGAPELHPDFEWMVRQATTLQRHVMVRHNLTVTFDPHPATGQAMTHLPQFFAEQRCEVVSSLPYYQEFFTDAQRGDGVFQKSIRGLQQLNALGYGVAGSGLVLNLVYNPVGPYLPAAQAVLQADYQRELGTRFGIVFNSLFTITNMPINRFALHLRKSGQYEAYMDKLLAAFNPQAASGVMCRSLISVAHDGALYDCDFNQMLSLPVDGVSAQPATIFNFDFAALMQRRIRFGSHCLACTAGAGLVVRWHHGLKRLVAPYPSPPGWKRRVRAGALAFAAGALAVLLVHQPLLALLNALTLAPWPAYSMAATRPLGVPAVVSAAFWGGLWMVLLCRLVCGRTGWPQWAEAAAIAACGGVLPTAVAALLIALEHAPWPAPAGASVALLAVGVNAFWALGSWGLLRVVTHDRSGPADARP